MYYKRQKRKLCLRIGLLAAAGVLAIAFIAAVVMRATAYSVSGTVLDGEDTYSVKAAKADPDLFLAAARRQGMQELTIYDTAEFDGQSNTLTVCRGVEMKVTDGGETVSLTAHRGATVEEALEENGMGLGPDDIVSPDRELVITAAVTVDVKRCCHVTVTFAGREEQVMLYGGTVSEALKEAGLKFTEDMACNESIDAPLTDGMELIVTRLTAFTVTADGKTGSYKVSCGTVGEALEKCGFKLSEEDRLNVPKERRLTAGMRIVIQRVRVEEETETEDIEYGTQYVTSRELPEGKTQLLSAGLKGEKELVYRATYVDGKLESRDLLSEEVKSDPVKQIVMRGTGLPTTAPKLEFIDDGSGATPDPTPAGGGKPSVSVSAQEGVLTDPWGNEISYSKTITGTCTAYCIPGGTTSIGLEAMRGVIAVDPDIIPYGTRMYVASPDGRIVYGYGVAGDTGGACMAGDIIADLCYDTLEECSIIGRREMVLYILQ